MKYSLYIAALALGALATSCADEFDQAYKVNAPASLQKYAYLKDYAPLKECLGTNAGNFQLGAGVTVSDFNNGATQKSVAVSNFTEVVAGNAMKMASCVGETGSMNFADVEDFVNNATAAGLNVYGHTLAWHAQQPVKWLNSLLAEKPAPANGNGGDKEVVDMESDLTKVSSFPYYVMGYTPEYDSTNGLNSVSPGSWYQYFILDGITTTVGTTYQVTVEIKGEGEGSFNANMGWGWGDGESTSTTIAFTSEWETKTFTFAGPAGGTSCNVVFQPGGLATTFYVKNIKVSHIEKSAGSVMVEKELVEKRNCFKVSSQKKVEVAWESQMWLVTSGFKTGDSFEFSADVRATNEGSVGSQMHAEAGAYKHWAAVGNLNFTTEWQKVTLSGTFPSGTDDLCKTVAFNLNDIAKATDFYLDNVSFKVNGVEQITNGDAESGDATNPCIVVKEAPSSEIVPIKKVDEIRMKVTVSSNTIPLTAQEKYDTLYYAMDTWINGMMKATAGKVKAWDVVNEAISGADNDGDGNYDLQHGAEGSSDFFWQDYFGDVEYVRVAVGSARRHFAEHGGNAADLKLFINDYNLESTWDDNKKLKSLVNWISKWENDSVKIDGIGSQMHISYNEDANKQARQEACIENMLKIMVESGKLVRISELDMGYTDEFGDKLLTADLTEEQHKQMAEFYKWIVKKYFEIVPAAQRYGICQWCMTDSPSSSGWRGGEPTGLWDLDYNRKHTYAGFADGLKEATK